MSDLMLRLSMDKINPQVREERIRAKARRRTSQWRLQMMDKTAMMKMEGRGIRRKRIVINI